MKLKLTMLAFALSLSVVSFAQENSKDSLRNYTYRSSKVSKFTQESKRFNDWAVSFGAGVPLMQSAELTSIKGFGSGKNLFGWSAYFSVDKALTHAFGLKLQYDKGESRQGFANTKDHVALTGNYGAARTQYDAISLLGDINFSNLFRRVDNHSTFKWALHGYAGIGSIAYKAYRQDPGTTFNQALITEVKPFKLGSLFTQAGAGVKYRATKSVDLEGRVMYLITGDDSFDGSVGTPYNKLVNDNPSDNLFNITLGATLNLGKHESHLFWHDPLQEIYYKLDVLANKNQDVEVCKKGDRDNDGVCDDWDRQLDTPAGARVDGAGVALDTDLDGVIDLYDNCVTEAGTVENGGCPVKSASPAPTVGSIEDVNKDFEGIEFELGKDVIRSVSFDKLNHAAGVIKTLDSNGKFLVIGCTDTRGKASSNQILSEKRANAVKKYLEDKGVNPGVLFAEGHGMTDLKYPECNPATKCPEWKNEANRRVYFKEKN